MTWSCPCGFDPRSVDPTFSAAWHTAHRDHHLVVFPWVDHISRANLDWLIARTARRQVNTS